jgi:hypothetical protein
VAVEQNARPLQTMPVIWRDVTSPEASSTVEAKFIKLEAYCRAHDWAGFDPYDALNSELFARTPLANSRLARLAFTQILKRSPVDVRRLLRISSQHDPKATALFLMSYVKRARLGNESCRTVAKTLVSRLLRVRSPGTFYSCWGYSFPWQTRHRLVPRYRPNLVGTVFAANALLDAYEIGLGDACVSAAASAGEYIAKELYWAAGAHAGFAYPMPDVRVPVHNANFLGAALLCRLARLTGAKNTLDVALRVVRYSAGSQREDGSWPYGLAATQQWVDNFHTGYNLCALQAIGTDLSTDEFEAVLRRGFEFYRRHFFTANAIPKYFHDRTYPIDIHCVAQSVITLISLSRLDVHSLTLAHRVLSWATKHMWDDRGFFYYRVLRTATIRTSYMRWSQAWMLLALVTMADESLCAAVPD